MLRIVKVKMNSKYPKNLGYFFYAYKRFKGDLRGFFINIHI